MDAGVGPGDSGPVAHAGGLRKGVPNSGGSETRSASVGTGAWMAVSEVQLLWDARAILGEGPIWSPSDRSIYWVDIKGQWLHQYGLDDGGRISRRMPEPIGWVIRRTGRPGFIAGFKSGIAELDLDPVRIRRRLQPELDQPENRLNDAKADRKGRIWFGSMDDAEARETGSFYRLDRDFTATRVDSGYGVANGPALSPDETVLYHTDSAKRLVYRFAVDPDGGLSNKQVFARFSEHDGYPDGMAVDADGGIWIAQWLGWRVTRFKPDGTRDRVIAIPVARATSCVFAGPNLDRLIVTTASIGVTAEDRANQPHAGGLFEVDPGCRGLMPCTAAL